MSTALSPEEPKPRTYHDRAKDNEISHVKNKSLPQTTLTNSMPTGGHADHAVDSTS